MSKVVIVPVTGAQNLSAINDNFQTIADTLNEQVLFRNNPPGEPNQVITDVDMNGKRIYNLPQPVSPSEPVRYQDLGDVTALTDTARGYAESAEAASQQATQRSIEAAASATSANTSATNAANSATVASDSATIAQNSAIAAEEAASQADRVPQTSATGAAIIPAGTELERPNPLPSSGLLVRGNTDTGKPEWYDRTSGAWKEFASGGELFDYAWHNGPRSSIDVGRVATDGQQLLLLTHPDVCQAIWDGKQHAVDESVWQADPTKRNCWSRGDGSSWVRVPDLNAALVDTGKPFYLRGGSDALNGTSVGDAGRNLTGSFSANSYIGLTSGVLFTIRFGGSTSDGGTGTTNLDTGFGFDASRQWPVADEFRVKTAYGVMTVRVFTEVSNVGALDAGQLATQLGVVDSKVQTLDANTGFTIVYPNGGTQASPANVATNSRYVMPNPFPGFQVVCVAEVFYDGNWGATGYLSVHASGGQYIYFTSAQQLGDSVVLTTGQNGLLGGWSQSGGAHSNTGDIAGVSLPCRVKVWKLKGGI